MIDPVAIIKEAQFEEPLALKMTKAQAAQIHMLTMIGLGVVASRTDRELLNVLKNGRSYRPQFRDFIDETRAGLKTLGHSLLDGDQYALFCEQIEDSLVALTPPRCPDCGGLHD